ncbi:MAG: Thioredoxin, phage-associated [uncultured Sulfurovum sp.]|uniref:Thioredoxin, phage-associated n=1 Tax=uncultured Sulfurovum sp. TaxID=269237 RepID=A0A6S6RXM5_9BACT|nr:MAG: Thioredoxin, phage-associated [uncultured Sulfurovum sp.]
MNIKKLIQNFEEEQNCQVVYITMYGSKLYGTDNPNSDTDYKGIFIPNKNDVLLKRDIEHYNFNSNEDNTKNSKDDIDLQLFSIYKFFTLLKKGETGAMDILFSMFRADTQVFNDEKFTSIIMENYKKFYNRNLHSFVGYCVGQSKVYNVRGERFNELHSFVNYFNALVQEQGSNKLETMFPQIDKLFEEHPYKYINYAMGDTSRGSGEPKQGKYVEVLGKRFLGTVTIAYFSEKITEMEEQFGNRARASAKGVDFKALSHAVRVIDEVEELIDHDFITFPLQNRVYITSVKEGNEKLEDVMDYIDDKLTVVQRKLEESGLAERSDEAFIDGLTLELLSH